MIAPIHESIVCQSALQHLQTAQDELEIAYDALYRANASRSGRAWELTRGALDACADAINETEAVADCYVEAKSCNQ